MSNKTGILKFQWNLSWVKQESTSPGSHVPFIPSDSALQVLTRQWQPLCCHPLPSCLAHLAHCMGRFLAHLSWKWEVILSSRYRIPLVRGKLGSQSQTTIYPYSSEKRHAEALQEPPWQQDRKSCKLSVHAGGKLDYISTQWQLKLPGNKP